MTALLFIRRVWPMLPEAEKSPLVCETPRLILRKFNENDAEAIFSFQGDPEIMRFSVNGPATPEGIRTKYLPGCLTRYSRDGVGQWAVIRKSDGALIGECGICVHEVDGTREYEIGYRLRRDCWRQGLATEAARACRDYGFSKVGLSRLVSIIEAENAASIRVAKKIGMTFEKHVLFHQISALLYRVANPGMATA